MEGNLTVVLNTNDPEQIERIGESLVAMSQSLRGIKAVTGSSAEQCQTAPTHSFNTSKPLQMTFAETDGIEPGATNIGLPPMPQDFKEDPAGIDYAAVQEAAAEEMAPPPAAPAPPPAAPAPPPAAPASQVELDIEGLPWDARIHSETKGKNKTGEWRLRRNVDKDLVASVMAQLKAAMSASGPSAPAPAPAPAPASTAPAPASTAPAPAGNGLDWPNFLRMMIKTGYSNDTMKPHLPAGIENVPLLAGRPDIYVDLAVRLFGYVRTPADPVAPVGA